MRYLRLSHDGGTTRFDEGDLPFASAVFAPPAPPLDVSAAVPARELLFIRFPAGWSDPSHPSPARQWMFVLAGRGEVTAGPETRTIPTAPRPTGLAMATMVSAGLIAAFC